MAMEKSMTGLRFVRIQIKALSSELQTPAPAIMQLMQPPISAGKPSPGHTNQVLAFQVMYNIAVQVLRGHDTF